MDDFLLLIGVLVLVFWELRLESGWWWWYLLTKLILISVNQDLGGEVPGCCVLLGNFFNSYLIFLSVCFPRNW